MVMSYQALCKFAHGIVKTEVGGAQAERVKKGLDFLELDVTAEETQSLAMMVLFFGIAISVGLIVLLSAVAGFSILWLLFPAAPIVLYFYLKRYPIVRADSERKKVAGQMPEVVGYLIMSIRINPNIERAIVFGAQHNKGLFKRKLDVILSDVSTGRSSAESGLARLVKDFEKWPEFGRAVDLLISSNLERTEEARQKTLDKSSDALLSGLVTRTEKDASALHLPVMLLFTFGVLLPLVFIAIIPFMSLMGINVGIFEIGLLYTIGLPLLLYFIVGFVSSNRPATILAPRIPAKERLSVGVFLAVFLGTLLCLPIVLGKDILGPMQYLPILWGFSGGAGVLMLVTTKKTRVLRKKTKSLEGGFGSALHRTSTFLSEGRPLESALEKSGSDILSNAATNVRNLNAGVKAALFDHEFGALKDVHSDMVRGVLDIISSIVDKGSESMANIGFRLADHMENMKKCDDAIQRALGGVVSSMRIIAVFVAPLVGGMISSMSVVLADTVSRTQDARLQMGDGGGPLDPSLVSLIIGIYALESAAILSIFGTSLIHGEDGVMKRFSVGIALPVAVTIFTACLWLSNGLFSGLT